MTAKFRLHVAVVLTWLASRIAPRIMRSVFWGYGVLLADFPGQREKGRTFGVMTSVWTTTAAGSAHGARLQAAAIGAIERERVKMESEGIT